MDDQQMHIFVISFIAETALLIHCYAYLPCTRGKQATNYKAAALVEQLRAANQAVT